MLRPFSQIQIKQIPTPKWKNRDSTFILDFETEYSISSNWETHTDNAFIKFPKNVQLKGINDCIFPNSGTHSAILGGSGEINSPNISVFNQPNTIAPLIMKGDIITINHGYLFRNEKNVDCQVCTNPALASINGVPLVPNIGTDQNLFFGYVSSVGSDVPIEIKLEDNFYLLKRTPFDLSVWNKTSAPSGDTSLYGLMQHILDLVNDNFANQKNSIYPFLTLLDVPNSITAQFSLGYLEIGDMTCAEVLDKLQRQYHLISTFRGNVLQFGFPIYFDGAIPSNPELQANSNNFFCFRDIYNSSNAIQASANIFPSHDLEYVNKDDIILSATVQCKVINVVPGKSTLSGVQKTKVEKLKVLVYWDIVTSSFKYFDLSAPNSKVPLNPDGGERHEFYYPVDKSNPNPTIADLVKLGTEQLYKYHYTGFKGCFTTFGFPFVQWNDNINILDPIYSDRNGQYKIRKVVYKGGIKGISQEIHLDYRIDVPLPKNVKSLTLF